MRIVVSGAAGRLAQALLPALCADPAVRRVVAIDLVPIGFAHPKLEAVIADIGDATTLPHLDGADAFVSLAALLLRGRTSVATMRSINVDATRVALAAADRRGVGAIVHVSSAAVYGGGENLAETAPLAPLAGFRYAEQKAEVEAWIARDLRRAIVLRPVAILGPHAQPLLRRLFDARCYPRLPDPQPRFQCVHEDDVAHAIVLALAAARSAISGPFNLAAPVPFSLRELVRARHPRAPSLPPMIVRAMLAVAWGVARWGGEPGWHRGIGHSLTVDCARARALLGWEPHHGDWRTITGAARE